MAFTQMKFHLGYPSRSIFSAFSINRDLIMLFCSVLEIMKKYTFASSPVERIWSAWKGLNNRQRVKSFPNTYGGKMVINCEHQHSALDFSFRRLTAHYGEMQPWKLDRIRLRIITLNIAYLWHFFSDQNSLGSTFRSLTRFWWELSWIMVLTEDLLSLRLACVILYLWDFLRLDKKVKYNQRLVVKF